MAYCSVAIAGVPGSEFVETMRSLYNMGRFWAIHYRKTQTDDFAVIQSPCQHTTAPDLKGQRQFGWLK